MKPYEETRIAILGFGFLMDYMSDCYYSFIGHDNIESKIIAVTADERNLEEKRMKYPFEIMLNDNLHALRKIKPDIILFAPPPSVAPVIIENELSVYFSECADKPDIYAFPPSPNGKFYLERLGKDVFVCNILPNMIKEIGGVPLEGEMGYSTITFPVEIRKNKEKLKRLIDFMKPLGGVVEATPHTIMSLLSVYVMIDLWPHRLIEASHLLGIPHNLLSDDYEGMGSLKSIFSETMTDYLVRSGISKEKSKSIVEERTKLVFWLASKMEEDDLEYDMQTHSTPGGVFEKGMRLHVAALDRACAAFLEGQANNLREVIDSCLGIVQRHGGRLSDNTGKCSPHPGIHAMIFAVFVRKAKEKYGDEAETLIEKTVMEYGRQRGFRMRQRSLMDGKGASMEDYMAYGEWSADEGSMDIRSTRTSDPAITRVYRCPWVTEWSKFGYMSEGAYYCRYVDKSLVEGFNDKLNLGMNSIMSEGAEFCEFVWEGASLDRVDAVEKERRVLPWDYHIAHLVNCIAGNLPKGDGTMDSVISDINVIYDIELHDIIQKYIDTDFSAV